MSELILNASVKAGMLKDRIITGAIDRARNVKENGDIVQTIIIIALFVLICVVVGGILYTAIQGQANNVGKCISGGGKGTGCTNYSKP